VTTFAVAVVVAVLTGRVASTGEVPGWEQAIFHAVNNLPDWLEDPMWVFQLAGLLFAPLVVAAVAAAMHRWRLAIALAAFVSLKLLVEKGVVKQLVERQRPGTTICGAPDDFDPTCGHFRADVPLDACRSCPGTRSSRGASPPSSGRRYQGSGAGSPSASPR
jgi:hypothetical protein